MHTRPHTTPPPTPAANHTGVVRRWHAWRTPTAAMAFGWAIGTVGLSQAIALAVLAGLAVVLAAGVAHELRAERARAHEFDHIDARHRAETALDRTDRRPRQC